jgi:hypothetical protein
LLSTGQTLEVCSVTAPTLVFNILREKLKEQIARDRAEKASQVTTVWSLHCDAPRKKLKAFFTSFQSSKPASQVTTPAVPSATQGSSQSPLKEYTTCRLQVYTMVH